MDDTDLGLCLDVLAVPPEVFGRDDVAKVCEEPVGHYPGSPHRGAGWSWAG